MYDNWSIVVVRNCQLSEHHSVKRGLIILGVPASDKATIGMISCYFGSLRGH